MKDIIIIRGAQGSGKTTTAKLLKEKLDFPPCIELDWVRGYHLDPKWKKKSTEEEQMSFENLCFTVKNYLKHNYKKIILVGLGDEQIKKLLKAANTKNYLIVTLTIDNDKELKKRVLTESRDSGFKDFENAIKLNKELKMKGLLKNEVRLDNTHNDPKKTVKKIIELVR